MVRPIVKKITVNCTPDRAFDVFVNQTSSWWPLDKHAVSAMDGAKAKSVVIEPELGGAVYEITPDDKKVPWGKVIAFSKDESIAMTWHPGGDPDKATEVSVSFDPTESGTTVTLVHSEWERLGEQAETMRKGYDSGWVFVFNECFGSCF